MTEFIMSLIVIFSLGIFLFGLSRRLTRLADIFRRHRPIVGPRSQTPFPTPKRPWLESVWLAHGVPWMYWRKSDPLGFAAHLAYHLGLYTAVAAYAIGLIRIWQRAETVSPWYSLLAVCGWAVENQSVPVVCRVFQGATVLAVIGLSVPLIRHRLRVKAFRPPDGVVRALGLVPTPKPRRGRTNRERKHLGRIVLIADAALAVSFLLPETAASLIRTGHATFVATLLAIFPFTFLFHEMWIAVTGTMTVWRYRDGGV